MGYGKHGLICGAKPGRFHESERDKGPRGSDTLESSPTLYLFLLLFSLKARILSSLSSVLKSSNNPSLSL